MSGGIRNTYFLPLDTGQKTSARCIGAKLTVPDTWSEGELSIPDSSVSSLVATSDLRLLIGAIEAAVRLNSAYARGRGCDMGYSCTRRDVSILPS